MCAKMFCPRTGATINCIGDLAPYVSDEFLVLKDDYAEPGESKEETLERLKGTCLCPVNLHASFYGNGRWRIRPDTNSFLGDYLIVPLAVEAPNG